MINVLINPMISGLAFCGDSNYCGILDRTNVVRRGPVCLFVDWDHQWPIGLDAQQNDCARVFSTTRCRPSFPNPPSSGPTNRHEVLRYAFNGDRCAFIV